LDIDEGTATNSVYQWQDLIAVGFFTGWLSSVSQSSPRLRVKALIGLGLYGGEPKDEAGMGIELVCD
jgi:hypothetical protein